MKHIRLYIVLLALVPIFHLQAQNAIRGVSFDVGIAAGYSALGHAIAADAYPDLTASSSGDYGYSAHLGVNIFFTHIFGISLGCDFDRYGGAIRLAGQQTWDGVTDTDGELYKHTLAINSWRERQQQLYLSPQVLLLFAIPVNTVRVQIGVGAAYNCGIQASYSAKGDLVHTGFYAPWNLTLHDVDTHGFYHNDAFQPKGMLIDRGQYLSILAKVGVLIPVAHNLDLSLHFVGKYAVYANPRTTVTAGGKSPIGFREDATNISAEALQAHAFMPSYSSLFKTPITTGTYHPLFVGLEIGIRYTIPFRRHYPCWCTDD